MGRGKRWSDVENGVLRELVGEGLSVGEIVMSGRLVGRSPQAIVKQMERLGLRGSSFVGVRKSFVGQIGRVEVPGFEEFVERYVDAFNKLCGLEEFSRDDLERFRLIFMAAWKFRDLFKEYERVKEVEVRVEKLEKLVEQLISEKKEEDVEQAAHIG
jgi:hypothetical protein